LTDGSFTDLGDSSNDLEQEIVNQPIQWITLKQKFFTSGLISNTPFLGAMAATQVLSEEDTTVVKDLEMIVNLSQKSLVDEGFTYFFGPNNYQLMKKVADGFTKNVYLGWVLFAWINKWLIIPIFNFLETYVASYGIIIIILAFFIKLILSPISYKSYLSMAKMKVLKPQLDEIKEKFGDDMQKAQSAQMELYGKVGVNPLSGCIPMLLQMPILLAMFNFFPNSIELRQAGFLWADDLSSYDSILNLPFSIPFYGDHVSLFTLLMAGSTLLYTWSNQQMNASMQGPMKSMQYLMPVMMIFFFNNFSSGLTFYYFILNILNFGQQAIIKKYFIDEEKILKIMEENKARNKNKKKSKFQQRLEEAMKTAEETKKNKK
jgi:YidC/Oxa1 family membrane protein insertase